MSGKIHLMSEMRLVRGGLPLLLFLLAASVSFVSDLVSEPSVSDVEMAYTHNYDEQRNKKLTEDEFRDLKDREKKLFSELEKPGNVGTEVAHILRGKVIVLLFLMPVWCFLGYVIQAERKVFYFLFWGAIFSGALIFVNIIESLVYVSFFGLGQWAKRRSGSGHLGSDTVFPVKPSPDINLD